MLASLVKQNVKKPLSIEMLSTLLPTNAKAVFYDNLSRYKTLKDALGGKGCMVVLYNLHDKSRKRLNQAGHFILINTMAGAVEYFSSSGWSVAKELDITNSDPDIFRRLLGKNYITNTMPLEKVGDSNDCWRFCLARAILARMPLKKFQKLFNSHYNIKNADELVSLMTMLMVEKQIR